MRKTLLSIIFLLILLLVPTMVFATEGDVAKVGEETFATLDEAIEAAKSNEKEVVILKTIEVNNDITIDIDGVNITGAVQPLFSVSGGSVNVIGTGTITADKIIFNLKGNFTQGGDSIKAEAIIGSGVKLISKGMTCIYIRGHGAKTVVNGYLEAQGEYAGIQGNGGDGCGNTEIIVNSKAVVKSTGTGHGIYHPQSGKLTVNGGEISGVCGIEMRAGDLIVENGTIISTSKTLTDKPDGSGSAITGVGIAIAQHSTKQSTSVIVNGGNIEGCSALYESNPQNNEAEAIAKVSIAINGGEFEAVNGGTEAVYSQNNTQFITGGIFNTAVNQDYLVKGVTSEIDSNGNYVVGTRYNVVINESTNGSVTSVERAMEGEIIQLTVTPAIGYELNKLTVLNADNNEIKVVDGKFTMPSGGVTVAAEFKKIEYAIVIENTTNGTVTASKETAVEGETVELTVTPDDGYKLKDLKVITAADSEVEVADGKFVMPNLGVIVIAEFEEIPQPEPTPTPTPTPEVDSGIDFIVPEDTNVSIGIVQTETTKAILDTSLKANEKLNIEVEKAKNEGKDVVVEVKMQEIKHDNVKEEEKEKILETVTKNQKVYQYFDISVLVTADKEELGKITQLTEKMKFSLEISKDLIQEGRKFFILKLHEDKVERIEAVLNGDKLEFETDQFSTFALAYEDVETSSGTPGEQQQPTEEKEDIVPPVSDGKDDTPKTGLISIPAFIWVSIAVMALAGMVTTKKRSKHSK